MIQKRTCWKSHLANTHSHTPTHTLTHTQDTRVCQQEKQNCHSNSRKNNNNNNSKLCYLQRWQWQRATLLSHVTRVGRQKERQKEREREGEWGSVKYESWAKNDEWQNYTANAVLASFPATFSLLPLRDMWPLMRINSGLTFCYFVIVISVLFYSAFSAKLRYWISRHINFPFVSFKPDMSSALDAP